MLFFDNYDTRYSGYETMSHAVMYRNFHKGHLDAEAAFVMRINELSEKNDLALRRRHVHLDLELEGSDAQGSDARQSLTAFPVSADRFRLGYSLPPVVGR